MSESAYVSAPFVHLAVRSAFSLLESMLKTGALANWVRENNAPALAVTDHNNLFGALEISEALVAEGVQPVVGAAFDVQPEGHDAEPYRIDLVNRHCCIQPACSSGQIPGKCSSMERTASLCQTASEHSCDVHVSASFISFIISCRNSMPSRTWRPHSIFAAFRVQRHVSVRLIDPSPQSPSGKPPLSRLLSRIPFSSHRAQPHPPDSRARHLLNNNSPCALPALPRRTRLVADAGCQVSQSQ